MSSSRDAVGEAVEQLVPQATGANDWPDVVRRARRGRRVGANVGAPRARRTALALVVACVLAVPALAATGTLQSLWRHRGPEIGLSAELRARSGVHAGTVRVELPGAFATQDRPHHLLPHRMLHRGGLHPAATYPLRWRVRLTQRPARSGRIVYRPGVAHAGTTVAELCRPCGPGATGEIALTRAQAALLLNGQLAFTFQSDDGELSGTVARLEQHGLIPSKLSR